ncbi:hypothetical protein [Pseudaquabacterium rugosum]|uniref:NACHT domain-containing protein n=1 Tax=Pseudaquabacterium rugosum TaxID=2984194 RepID=A0ABU9B8U1_9BURK
MDITTFRRVLTAFADEPSDVDIRLGKVVAQVRDDVIDATISYADGDDQQLRIEENGETYSARAWLINRVAKIPQLADRIIASTSSTPGAAERFPFVVPSALLTPDLAESVESATEFEIPDAVEALLTRASKPLPGATSVLYLTSDAGEGKTTLISRAARLQAERFKEKRTSSLIVPVPLSGRAFLTFDDAVIAALVNKLRFNYLYFDAFVQLVRLGVVIPAFDGYEEMLVEGSRGEAVSALGNLVQQLDSSGTLIVAARKAFFEYLSFKTQAKLLDAIGDRSASFSRLALRRWSREQFFKYGELRKIPKPEEVYELVAARLGEDHPLLTRAVLVRRLFDVVADGADERELSELLGKSPHDYFFTFVDAIVKREAAEKWLARVSGEVMTPLLTVEEHHQLLSLIAQEMWQISSTSLRHDVLDVIVDIFGESLGKGPAATRQIKERVKQHSLLASDSARGGTLAFDHEDFQNFYLGESLGQLLTRAARGELQTFLSVAPIPQATTEQAVQHAIRIKADLLQALRCVLQVNVAEAGFTFCKENCSALAIRLAECIDSSDHNIEMRGLIFAPGSLAGRTLSKATFVECQFQPTSVGKSRLTDVWFRQCEFERIDLEGDRSLEGSSFLECKVDSIVNVPEGEHTYEPLLVDRGLRGAGASVNSENADLTEDVAGLELDERVKLLERFFRVFLRSTHVDEEVVKLRLGKVSAPYFFDSVIPDLLAAGVLTEVQWRGGGLQRRYKLDMSMSTIERSLERARGSYSEFLKLVEGSKD